MAIVDSVSDDRRTMPTTNFTPMDRLPNVIASEFSIEMDRHVPEHNLEPLLSEDEITDTLIDDEDEDALEDRTRAPRSGGRHRPLADGRWLRQRLR